MVTCVKLFSCGIMREPFHSPVPVQRTPFADFQVPGITEHVFFNVRLMLPDHGNGFEIDAEKADLLLEVLTVDV